MRILAATLLALVLLVPAAMAQHEHMGTATAIIAHDTPANGRTYVGDVTSFAIVDDADHDLHPDVHQNNHIRVSENGAVLWEASAAAGHDYDGVNTFSIVFPVPGTYEVALIADDGMVQAHYDGTVEAPNAAFTASIDLQAPASVPALQPADFTLRINAPNGTLIDHSDAVFEVREGLDLVFRTHAHTHTAPMLLSYAFPRPGTYTVRATGYLAYATGKHPEFAPVAIEKTVTVGLPASLPMAMPGLPSAVGQNIVTDGTTQGGPYKLVGTYDPYTVGSPGTQMHLTALVMDPATMQSVQHVDFTATLTGPLGTVFSSKSLHEYDGIYELVAKEPAVGAYTLTIDALYGAWTGHLVMPYTISLSPPLPDPSSPAPPVVGPVSVGGQAQDAVAGKATTMTLAAKDAAGSPYQHSELDVQVLDAKGNTLLWTKLHTHGSGLFPLTFAFPVAGQYKVRVAPSALDGLPLNYVGGALNAAVDIPVTVGAGPGIPAALLPVAGAAQHAAPAAGILLAVAVLGLAASARRRA